MEQDAINFLENYPQQIFPKNAYIAQQGKTVEYIYYLFEGNCTRNLFTIKGDEIIYDERTADQSVYCLIGALTLYSPIIVHETNFIAKTTCVCHKIYYKDFLNFLSLYPSVLHELLSMAMKSYRNINANFHAKQKGQAPCRVCSFILENAKMTEKGYILKKYYSISEIARYLGMHRITVNKIILALCDEDCLFHGEDGLEIINKEQLQHYAYGEAQLNYLKRQTL